MWQTNPAPLSSTNNSRDRSFHGADRNDEERPTCTEYSRCIILVFSSTQQNNLNLFTLKNIHYIYNTLRYNKNGRLSNAVDSRNDLPFEFLSIRHMWTFLTSVHLYWHCVILNSLVWTPGRTPETSLWFHMKNKSIRLSEFSLELRNFLLVFLPETKTFSAQQCGRIVFLATLLQTCLQILRSPHPLGFMELLLSFSSLFTVQTTLVWWTHCFQNKNKSVCVTRYFWP